MALRVSIASGIYFVVHTHTHTSVDVDDITTGQTKLRTGSHSQQMRVRFAHRRLASPRAAPNDVIINSYHTHAKTDANRRFIARARSRRARWTRN